MSVAPPRWWCELAWLGGDDATAGVVLSTAGDGTIGAVTTGVGRADAAGATVLPGLTLPGLVNAHSHAFHRALRGRTQAAGGGSFWTWREAMYGLAGRLDPDSYRELATVTFAEMALSGITTVGEFHYLHHDVAGHPYDGDAMGQALLEAARAAGIRLTLLDTCYLAGGIGRPPEAVQRRFSDGDASRWSARVDALASSLAGETTVCVGAAIHSVRAVPPGPMAAVADWARGQGRPAACPRERAAGRE